MEKQFDSERLSEYNRARKFDIEQNTVNHEYMEIIISFGTNDPNEWQYVDHVILINVFFNTKPFYYMFFYFRWNWILCIFSMNNLSLSVASRIERIRN